MEAKIIKKYQKYNISQLLLKATKVFNKFIRERDTDDNGYGVCISSGQMLRVPSANAHAGHYFSAGKYPQLRYNEDNVHLQGKSDNYFNGGNLIEYRKNLIKKIGIKRVEKLEYLSTQKNYKWDRFYLIEIIEKYK